MSTESKTTGKRVSGRKAKKRRARKESTQGQKEGLAGRVKLLTPLSKYQSTWVLNCMNAIPLKGMSKLGLISREFSSINLHFTQF